ncbi:hypothetical protein LCGC14_3160970, partial [marine sediment metagenome]
RMSRETAKRAKRILRAVGKTSDIAGSEMILPNVSNVEMVARKDGAGKSIFTQGSVVFIDGNGLLAQDNFNLFWNSATNELQSHHIKIVSDGSQASPALKFNDTNTGFFKSGDSIRTSINNSTKMTVDATGVGIGIANPLDVLHIGAGNNLGITITSTNAPILRLYTSAGAASARNWAIMTTQVEQGDFLIRQSNAKGGNPQSAGTTRFYIDNSGNVGIGTTSPSTNLEVKPTSAGHGIVVRESDDGNNAVVVGGLGGGGFVNILNDGATVISFTNSGTSFINNGGNVGIGTTDPDSKLEVNGDVHIDGDLFFETDGSGLPYGSMFTNSTITVGIT